MKSQGEKSQTYQRIPDHLLKYVVDQNYDHYTHEDQSVWRFIMRQLKSFLSTHAHECYVEGLKKTGIEVDHIPNISDMDRKLNPFGWGAIPVSGFIPPAAFMEFQALGLLPIASDMRSIDHLNYTPAPDIVHEAAGHAPILIHPKFSAYLKKYAEIARKAIITHDDLEQYEAIRKLSDIKESPTSTPEDILAAEAHLDKVQRSLSSVSEAGWLARMNWWTAEYGLIGSINKPKIFGAGLLSSVGESSQCLSNKVKKIPLSLECIQVGYDITEPQPQLFVTPDFDALQTILEELAQLMSFRIGGPIGLKRAQEAHTVNTVELDSGLQISGILNDFFVDKTANPDKAHDGVSFVKFSGPSALSVDGLQLKGHGTSYHQHGFSSPLGPLVDLQGPLHSTTSEDLRRLGILINQRTLLQFQSGLCVQGTIKDLTYHQNKLILISWQDVRVTHGQQILFLPEWGTYDMAVGHRIVSVFGGAADKKNFGKMEDFVASRVMSRQLSDYHQRLFDFYFKIQTLRKSLKEPGASLSTLPKDQGLQKWTSYCALFFQDFSQAWLIGLELFECSFLLGCENNKTTHRLVQHLNSPAFEKIQGSIHAGLHLARQGH